MGFADDAALGLTSRFYHVYTPLFNAKYTEAAAVSSSSLPDCEFFGRNYRGCDFFTKLNKRASHPSARRSVIIEIYFIYILSKIVAASIALFIA